MFSVYMIDRTDSYKLYYVDSYKTRAQAESTVYKILKTTRESCYISESADLNGVKLADVWSLTHGAQPVNL